MKIKEYLEWKHQKKLKQRRKKNGSSKRQNKINDHDS